MKHPLHKLSLVHHSPVGTVDVKGNDLRQWAIQIFGKDVPVIPGRAYRVRLAVTTPIEGLCCWLRDDWARVLIPPGQTAATMQALARHRDGCVHLTDVTSVFAAFQVAGPRSRSVLEKLTPLDLRPSRFPDLACAQGSVAKVHALVLRHDLAGLPAYWLFVSRDCGEFVHETILHAGEEYGIVPFGDDAYDRLKRGFTDH
ncbi:MAG: hypothetical protein HY710_08415 [Candidatus Latescibacteria bacterium]|nr:hypothetical protein [Candidatus Latescibacterota bacterium]